MEPAARLCSSVRSPQQSEFQYRREAISADLYQVRYVIPDFRGRSQRETEASFDECAAFRLLQVPQLYCCTSVLRSFAMSSHNLRVPNVQLLAERSFSASRTEIVAPPTHQLRPILFIIGLDGGTGMNSSMQSAAHHPLHSRCLPQGIVEVLLELRQTSMGTALLRRSLATIRVRTIRQPMRVSAHWEQAPLPSPF